METKPPKICFVAAEGDEAQSALAELHALYPCETDSFAADIIIALGGDGFMLRILRDQLALPHKDLMRPIYGMNRGTVGFLLNQYSPIDLYQRLTRSKAITFNPLKMSVENQAGEKFEALAINEVSLFRQTRQAADINITVDGVQRLEHLICDGVLVATPAGSTAYNFSAHGPILPIGSNLLALTPISPFRPRRWRGALLPRQAKIGFGVQNALKRPVSAVADIVEFRDIIKVEIAEEPRLSVTLLHDSEHNLEERIIREQFQA